MDFYAEKPWQFCLHLLIKETFANVAFEGCEPQNISVEYRRFIELTKADCKFPEILSQLSHIYCGKSLYSDPFLRERNTEKHPLGYFLSKRKERKLDGCLLDCTTCQKPYLSLRLHCFSFFSYSLVSLLPILNLAVNGDEWLLPNMFQDCSWFLTLAVKLGPTPFKNMTFPGEITIVVLEECPYLSAL